MNISMRGSRLIRIAVLLCIALSIPALARAEGLTAFLASSVAEADGYVCSSDQTALTEVGPYEAIVQSTLYALGISEDKDVPSLDDLLSELRSLESEINTGGTFPCPVFHPLDTSWEVSADLEAVVAQKLCVDNNYSDPADFLRLLTAPSASLAASLRTLQNRLDPSKGNVSSSISSVLGKFKNIVNAAGYKFDPRRSAIHGLLAAPVNWRERSLVERSRKLWRDYFFVCMIFGADPLGGEEEELFGEDPLYFNPFEHCAGEYSSDLEVLAEIKQRILKLGLFLPVSVYSASEYIKDATHRLDRFFLLLEDIKADENPKPRELKELAELTAELSVYSMFDSSVLRLMAASVGSGGADDFMNLIYKHSRLLTALYKAKLLLRAFALGPWFEREVLPLLDCNSDLSSDKRKTLVAISASWAELLSRAGKFSEAVDVFKESAESENLCSVQSKLP